MLNDVVRNLNKTGSSAEPLNRSFNARGHPCSANTQESLKHLGRVINQWLHRISLVIPA